jgi:DNA-binding transcriptional ArsR family regulator
MADGVSARRGGRASTMAGGPARRGQQAGRGSGRRPGCSAHRALSDEVVEVTAARARMLSEPLRVRLLLLLDGHDATVQELADRLLAAHQTVSKQLNVLYHAGMVSRRKDGRETHYALVDYVALWVIGQLANSAADHAAQMHELFDDE